MSDNIFKEIDEQYRQEQMLRFWHAHAAKLIVMLLIAITAAIGAGYWQVQRVQKKEDESYVLAHAVSKAHGEEPATARTTFAEAGARLTGERQVAATLAQAHEAAMAGDVAGAIREYDSVATTSPADLPERRIAEMSSLALQLDSGDPATLLARLDKLADDNDPWRFSAREFQALLAFRTGDKARAFAISSKLAKDKDAPGGVQAVSGQIAALAGEGVPPSPEPAASGPASMLPAVSPPSSVPLPTK